MAGRIYVPVAWGRQWACPPIPDTAHPYGEQSKDTVGEDGGQRTMLLTPKRRGLTVPSNLGALVYLRTPLNYPR